VLGPTGRNFAAGMSGGVAYVWDVEGDFLERCNLGMVDLEEVVEPEDEQELRTLIEQHVHHTDSAVGRRVLDHWPQTVRQFVKVMPIDYKRVLQAQQADQADQADSGSGAGAGETSQPTPTQTV